jgi:hypothetical protein
MTDAEIREVFEQLARMLRDRQMGWVVDQVRDDIRAGVTTVRAEPIQDSSTARKLKVSADSLTSVQYSALQELELLIAAMRRAVIDAARMEQEVVQLLASEDNRGDIPSPDVVFVGEPPDSSERTIASPESLTPRRLAAVQRLSSSLDSLLEDAARAS